MNMKREFIMLPEFDKWWVNIGLNDDDLMELQDELLINPEKGDLVSGTGGLRKIRFKVPGKGKRGGARAVYVDFAFYGKVYLINVYSKNEKLNLTDAEKKMLKKKINSLKLEARK